MLQNPKILQTSCIKLPSPKLPPALPPQIQQCSKFSRRELAILSNSSLFLAIDPLNLKAQAEDNFPDAATENQNQNQDNTVTTSSCADKNITKRAFLDISIDGQPMGRIVIGLNGETAPAGAARFGSLVSGAAGISYRRKEFIKIMPNYVQHGGVRSFGVDAELAQKTGSNLAVESLVNEWERENNCAGIKNTCGSVSIIVRNPLKPPPKMKLIARGGKLEIDEEQVGTDPNGTEFVIATKDSPELDASNLVIGRVLEGIDVVDKIGQVKTVNENTSSPYFR